MTDNHVCVPVVDADGLVLGHARVSPDVDERGQQALVSVLEAARRLMAEQDAADPEAAEERGRRQAAAIARIRERVRRRGEAG
jgi:transcription elongation GreA/GreB family factor